MSLILIATGSELSLAIEAATMLNEKNIKTRVVSAPCLEWFNEQPQSYREEVLPPYVRARVSIEAGISQGWREIVGDSISLEHFGASASHTTLFKEFGFTVENVLAAANRTLERVK